MAELKITVRFWCSDSGNEPVREWLSDMKQDDRKLVGQTILTVQYRWPLGMPTVRKMDSSLWEVRVNLTAQCIARVFFTIVERNTMVLLHGYVKKSKRTPGNELKTAHRRLRSLLAQE